MEKNLKLMKDQKESVREGGQKKNLALEQILFHKEISTKIKKI